MAIRIPIFTFLEDKGLRGAQKGFAALNRTLKNIAGAVLAGFSVNAINNFSKESIKAAEAAQVANARLENIARSMGIFGAQTSAVTARLDAFANKQMMIIGQDDELIKSTQAKLLTFKNLALTADEAGSSFDRATKAAFDLAAAGFGSAESNAVQLGKALQEPVKGLAALRRAGVTFTESEKAKIKALVDSNKQLEAQDVILTAIEKQVGGTAAATATASQKMNVALGEVSESLGEILLPYWEDFADRIIELAPDLITLLEELGDPTTVLGEKFQSAATSVGFFDDALTALSDRHNTQTYLGGTLDAITLLNTGLAGIVFFAGKAGEFIGTLFQPTEVTNNFFRTFGEDYDKFINGIADRIRKARRQAIFDAAYERQMAEAEKLFGKKEAPALKFDTPATIKKTTQSQFQVVQEVIKDAQANVKKVMDNYNEAVAQANDTYAKEQKEANDEFARIDADLRATQTADLTEALRQHNADRLAITREYAQNASDIIQQSLARLRDAFRGATSIALTSLFSTETVTKIISKVEQITDRIKITTSQSVEETLGGTAESMIKGLSDKLKASKALLENASRLAAAGFSQTFIEQVVSAGTDTGNQLAESILAAAPESQSELQKLFTELETTSETGIDQLAQSIYDRHGLATRELKALYEQNQSALTDALIEEQKAYDDAVVAINKTFADSLADATKERNDAIAQANADLKTALSDSAKDLVKDLADIETAFGEKVASFGGKFGGLKGTIDKFVSSLQSSRSTAELAAILGEDMTGLSAGLSSGATDLSDYLSLGTSSVAGRSSGTTNITVNVTANDRISGSKAGEAAVAAISNYVAKNGSAVGFITGGRAVL